MDLVEEVLAQIADNLNVSIYRLCLSFQDVKMLKKKTLADYKIKMKDRLKLTIIAKEFGKKIKKLYASKTTIKISISEQSMVNYSDIR